MASDFVQPSTAFARGKFVTVDPPGSAGTLPYSINDLGAITGYYIDANNVYHGFLRIP